MSPSAENNWRILCIDDEPDVLEILKTALGLKYEVVAARNGMEAVGLLDFCDADFVICDVRMPRMDGFQTVEAIRRHPDYLDVPVFFLTAETGREMAQRGFASGGNLYLTKPFDPMRVLQNIEYFLEQMGRSPRPKRIGPEEVERRAQTPQDEAPLPQAAPQASAQEPTEPRVIVIGSRPRQIERVRTALQTRYECIVCADPLESLHQLFRYEPDILIINPAIPHLSGWGLVQLIHQNAQLRKLPIVLLEDDENPLDRRLVPSITKFPPLAWDAGEAEVVGAVETVRAEEDFRVRSKSAPLRELLAEEDRAARERLQAIQQRRLVETAERERYRSIQTFIDRNFR